MSVLCGGGNRAEGGERGPGGGVAFYAPPLLPTVPSPSLPPAARLHVPFRTHAMKRSHTARLTIEQEEAGDVFCFSLSLTRASIERVRAACLPSTPLALSHGEREGCVRACVCVCARTRARGGEEKKKSEK